MLLGWETSKLPSKTCIPIPGCLDKLPDMRSLRWKMADDGAGSWVELAIVAFLICASLMGTRL